MLYKMIYFSNHKFAFSNLRFSQFYKHFRQLREKYAFKLKIKYTMLISSKSRIWWCTYICIFLKKPLHSTHSTELFKIFFSLLTLSTAFLQKASGPGKNQSENWGTYCFCFLCFVFYLSLAVQYSWYIVDISLVLLPQLAFRWCILYTVLCILKANWGNRAKDISTIYYFLNPNFL